MNSLALRILSNRKSPDRQLLAQVCCAYCRQRWGPWRGLSVEPCDVCARPLFRTRALNPLAPRNQVSSVLDTINAAQGVIVIAAIGALMLGWLTTRSLGQVIAMAMFIAASAHTADGVLGFKTGIIRTFGQIVIGAGSRPASVGKMIAGIIAFGISFLGIVTF